MNRSKTKKWVEAKPYSYDGDDWGDYDEYDEYGADQAPPPPQPAAVANLRQPGSRFDQSSRSFTDPQQQGPPHPGRRNSFEAGEEHRAFSSGTFPLQQSHTQQIHGAASQAAGPRYSAQRQVSAAESDTSDTPQHRRDFVPAALPPPLQTKLSPAPGSASNSPLNPKYPIQKSGIGQVDSPGAISPRESAPSNPVKPVAFIRPADIYKRFEEERQRERAASIGSSQPSLDPASRAKGEAPSEHGSNNSGKNAAVNPSQSLETVPEGKGKSNFPADNSAAVPGPSQSQSDYALPQVRRISAFDNEFWSSDRQPQAEPSHASASTPLDDQGFRSVVDQAFNRSDDQRSVPPTPISKQSDLSRSNTESTSGISPIMSRVPSSATAALKRRNDAGADSTPVIAEELNESGTPASSRPTSSTVPSAPHQVAHRPPPASHSHNLSSTSLPRSGLVTPNSGESPARSPVIEPQKVALEPESVQYSMLSPTSPENLGGYATREADIASAIKLNPTKAMPELGAAEMESQHAFLASHQSPDQPLSDVAPRSRSESPSKGRVQELAGKFGDVSHPRRGSTQSNTSRNSIQSWERSPETSRPSSPTKTTLSRPTTPAKEDSSARPAAARERSFRPKLPGQWESYATNANPTPSDQGDKDVQLEDANPKTPATHPVSSPLDEVDLTPTTTKHPVLATDPSKSTSNPLAALKAAGTAMGEAIQASVGLGSSSNSPSQGQEGQVQGQYYGDVYLSRPLQPDRTASSNSSIPPTPPDKDSPESEELPPPPPLKQKSPEAFASSNDQQTAVRPKVVPQLSTDVTEYDEESDRLRKEIVASLGQPKVSEGVESNGPSPSTAIMPPANRASSIFPSEYESYWAGGDHASPRPSNDLAHNISEHPQASANVPPSVAAPTTTQASDAKPPLINQFSWENDKAPLVPPEGQAPAGANAQASDIIDSGKEAVSSSGQQPEKEKSGKSFQDIPEHYFGPSHVAASTKPEAINELDVAVRSPTPPPDSEKPAAGLERAVTVKEASPPSGLHVVNNATNPEAVDMPPRLSADLSQTSQPSTANPKESEIPQQQGEPAEKWPVALPPTQDHGAKSPTSDKPLGYRDIVTMKSSTERIASYNKTRDYWASADHGLNDWIASAMAANPQLVTQPLPYRPTVATSSPTHHKPTGSLSLFGKREGSSNTQSPSAPYHDQYNSAPPQAPSTPTPSGASADGRPQGYGAGSSGGRSTSQQMQSKGKDLLHTAGVLGGKGLGKSMTSAKGLFAKGKSRFKGGSSDKV